MNFLTRPLSSKIKNNSTNTFSVHICKISLNNTIVCRLQKKDKKADPNTIEKKYFDLCIMLMKIRRWKPRDEK